MTHRGVRFGCFPALALLALGCADERNDAPGPSRMADGGWLIDAALGESGEDGAAPLPPAPGEPDYAAAFPQERAPRLDIVMTKADYARMQEDMTAILGARGTGGGLPGSAPGGSTGGFAIPEEVLAACDGRMAGAPCESSAGGTTRKGQCAALAGARLLCLPEGFGPMAGMGAPGRGFGLEAVDLVPGTPAYAPAEVRVDGRVWKHVGVRYKGNSSLANAWRSGSPKMPLRLKFDEFEEEHPETKNQRFFGFQSLSLSNLMEDPSVLRAKLAMDVFERAGLPTPSTAYYRVFIDEGDGPVYRGLYLAAELPQDDAFLESTFGSDDGNLYKPSGRGARFEMYEESSYEKHTNEKEADFSDVRALYDALHSARTDAAAYRARIEQVFDVELFLHWLAINTVVQDWDQYGRMPHNYYLYGDPGRGGRLRWISWDHSYAMSMGGGFGGSAPSLSLDEVSAQWPLIRYLLDDELYRATYRRYVAATIAGPFEPVAMAERARAARALVEPYVVGDEGERSASLETFDSSYRALLGHFEARAQAVRTFLTAD